MMVPYRRGGFRGMGATPGYTPEQQAMADAFRSEFGAPAPTYVAPANVPVPACAFGPSMNTQECQSQLDAAEQLRLKLANNANYAVDLENCLNTFPQPTNCYERTFGLTLPGTTGGANPAVLLPDASTLLGTGQQPSINMIECQPGYHPNPTRTGCDMDAVAVPAPPPKPVVVPVPAVGGGGYVSEATDFLTQQVPIAGSSFPVWELAAAGVALLLFMGGRH